MNGVDIKDDLIAWVITINSEYREALELFKRELF